MTPAARVAAAIEVLADVEARRRPAVDALKDWGLARRFAGSGDRAAIAGLVYDGLRRKASSAWLMGDSSPRAVVIGALKQLRDLDEAGIAALFSGEGHAPAPLTEAERERLRSADLASAPDPVPTSITRFALRATFRAASTTCSVSGRGISTSGVTRNSRP